MPDKKDHFVQIIISIIGALAVIIAAIISPVLTDYLSEKNNQPAGTEKIKPNDAQHSDNKKKDITDDSLTKKQNQGNTHSNDTSTTQATVKPDSNLINEPPTPRKSQNKTNEPLDVTTVFDDSYVILCGYPEIKVKVTHLNDGKAAIRLTSTKQNIPNSSFRGYENTIPTGKIIELWKNCHVKFNYENKSGYTRIEVLHYGS